MSEAAHNPDDYCYRHPDRLSFVLCERCARTICLECQTYVDGHVFCPDDARASITPISSARKPRTRRVRTASRLLDRVTDSTPIVTYSILGTVLLLFLVDAFTRGLVTQYLTFSSSAQALYQPWTLVTAMFASGGALGLLFNGYTIYIFGRQLERTFGRQRFLILYLISGFGAAVIAFLLDGFVTSAIGAVFGLVGATLILARRMGGNHTILYISCAISLLFAFILGSWQASVGGLLAGAAVAFVYFFEGTAERTRRLRVLLVVITAALLLLAVVRAFAFQL